MANIKVKNKWILLVIIVLIFVIINAKELIPFLIIGTVVILSSKNKPGNNDYKGSGKNKEDIFNSILNSDFVTKNKEKHADFFKNMEEQFTNNAGKSSYENSSISNNSIESNIPKSKIISQQRKSTNNYVGSKGKEIKAYKSSYSAKIKNQKTYDYNNGKSIWDDYETVVETMFKNK